MIEIVILTFTIIFFLFFSGVAFSTIILPDSLRKDMIFLAPWMGTIAIAIVSVYLSMLGISMNQGVYIELSLFLLLYIYSLRKNKFLVKISLQTAVLGILTMAILVINLSPIIGRAGFATTVSLGNLDPLAYVHSGEYLIDHTVFDKFIDNPLSPPSGAASDIVSYSFRWGVALLFSFFGVLLKVQGYQLFSILIAVYFALSYPLVYYLAKFIVNKIKPVSWQVLMFLVFSTYGNNSTLLYMVYNAFFGQIVFAGIFSLFLILLFSLKQSKRFSIRPTQIELAVAITLSSATTLYPDGFILVYFPLLAYATLTSFFKKNLNNILQFAKLTFYAILVNPFTAWTTYKWILRMIKVTTANEKIGWETIRYSLPFEFLGFHNLYYSRDLPLFIDLCLGMALVLVMVIGFYKAWHKFLLANYIGFFLMFNFFFYFIKPNFFVYHRTVTYSLFIYSVLFSIGLAVILQSLQNKKIVTGIVIAIIFLTSRSTHRTYFQFYHHMRIVDRSLISLQELNNNQNISGPIITSDAYSANYDVWTRLWREYFLKNKKLISISNFGAVAKYIKDDTLYLSEKNLTNSYSPALLMNNITWENEFYQLGTKCISDECLVNSNEDLSIIDFKENSFQDSLIGPGWSIREADHRWVSASEAELKLATRKFPSTLFFTVSSLSEPQTMTVYLNSVFIGKTDIAKEPKVYKFPISQAGRKGINLVKFVFSNSYSPAILSGSADGRRLFGNFYRISLK